MHILSERKKERKKSDYENDFLLYIKLAENATYLVGYFEWQCMNMKLPNMF